MILKVLRWIQGYRPLTVRLSAGRRLWNIAAREGIFLWDLQQTKDTFTAKVSRKDYPILLEILQESAIFPESSREKGGWATIIRYRKRWGMVLGLILAAAGIYLSQQFVWAVRIEGANPLLEQELTQLLDELGVRPGAAKSSIDTYWVPISLRASCGDVAWAALNLYGVTAILRVLEYTPPPETVDTGVPANVIAAMDGQIVSMSVTDGHALVSVGDVVQKNQVLVTGVWQDRWGMTHLSRANAQIKAKIPLLIETNVDLTYPAAKLTGKVICRKSITVFGKTMPLFFSQIPIGQCRVEKTTVPVTLFGLELPMQIITERYIYYEPATLSRSQEQALSVAHRRLSHEERRLLEQGEIYQRELEASATDDTLTLTARYLILTEIGIQQEIMILEGENAESDIHDNSDA